MNTVFCVNIIEENSKCDIGSNKYNLLLDESNDVFVTKMLDVVVIYCSDNIGQLVSTFWDLFN